MYFLLGKKKAPTGSEHGLPKTSKTIGKRAKHVKWRHCGNGSAAAPPVGRGPICKEYLVKPMENQHPLRARRVCPCVLRCHMTHKTWFSENLQKPCENHTFPAWQEKGTHRIRTLFTGNLQNHLENKQISNARYPCQEKSTALFHLYNASQT